MVDILDRSEDQVNVNIYWPNRNYNNDFITVNNMDNLKDFQHGVDFHNLEGLFSFQNHEEETYVKRQARYVDLGFTSSMCTSRKNSMSGVSTPMKKSGTLSAKAGECFLLMTELSKVTPMKWLKERNLQCYHDPRYKNRAKKFADTIKEGNIVEYIRINDTSLGTDDGNNETLCRPHNDAKTNSSEASMAPIINLSTLIYGGTVRRNLGCASRKSIDSFLKSENETGTFTSEFINFVKGQPNQRLEVNEDLFDMATTHKGYVVGMDAVTLPCHLNPGVYHSVYLYPLMLLVQHFRLTLPEIVSLFIAISRIPNTGVPFMKAAIILLGKYNKKTLPPHCRGVRFGMLVHNLSTSIWLSEPLAERKLLRFYTYRPVRFERSYHVWKDECKHLLSACLHSWANYPDKKGKATSGKTRYQSIHKSIQNILPDCGVLITNHIIGMLSIVGLLPEWVQHEIMFDNTTRSAKFLREMYSLKEGSTQAGYRNLLSTLRTALENNIGRCFPPRILENVVCKLFREKSPDAESRNARFVDFLLLNQPVFTYDSNGISIFSKGNGRETVESFIEKFPYNGSQLTMREIATKLNITQGRTFPKDEEIRQFRMTAELFLLNSAVLTRVNFQYPKVARFSVSHTRSLNDAIGINTNTLPNRQGR